MTTLEKRAKAYDEALDTAKKFYETVNGDEKELVEKIFPELKENTENDDEKIRKALIEHFACSHSSMYPYKGFTKEQIIAWLEKQGNLVKYYEDKLDRCACDNFNKGYKKALEKQGEQKLTPIFRIGDTIIAKDGTYTEKEPFHIDKIEEDCYWDGENTILVCNQNEFEIFKQKSADKVEPKFKVGDWVVSNGHLICGNSLMRIVKVGLTDYLCRYCNGQTTYCREFIDKSYHLWTIQDAKDGDVLATKDAVFIFKHIDKTGLSLCKSHCEVIGDSKLGLGFDFSINGVYPAAKEQCEQLEKAITEAGYKWDAEHKELKKIEHKHICKLDNSYACVKFPFKAKVKSSSKIVTIISGQLSIDCKKWIKYCSDEKDGYKVYKPENLELVCDVEPNPTWSEEDENQLAAAINIVANSGHTCTSDWLKSIKDRYTWKPNNAQMDAIKDAIDYLGRDTKIVRKHLMSLYEQLKKLKQ